MNVYDVPLYVIFASMCDFADVTFAVFVFAFAISNFPFFAVAVFAVSMHSNWQIDRDLSNTFFTLKGTFTFGRSETRKST